MAAAAIAYRILGSVSEAEDLEASPTHPTSPTAFLSAVVTRISIDVLRSARRRREAYGGPWLSEPLLTDLYEDPERSAELAGSLSMAVAAAARQELPYERSNWQRRRKEEVRATELDFTQRVAFFRDVLVPLARGLPFGVWFIRTVEGVDIDHPLEIAEGRRVFELHPRR